MGERKGKKGIKEIKKIEKEKSRRERNRKKEKMDYEYRRTITFPENRSPPKQFPINWDPIGCLETSVTNHQSRPHKIPEEELCILYTVNVLRGSGYSTLGKAKKHI